MLTGQSHKFEDIPKDSTVRNFPRFQPGNFEISLQLVQQVEKMTAKKGCTPQLAINWAWALSRCPRMPTVIPISDARRIASWLILPMRRWRRLMQLWLSLRQLGATILLLFPCCLGGHEIFCLVVQGV